MNNRKEETWEDHCYVLLQVGAGTTLMLLLMVCLDDWIEGKLSSSTKKESINQEEVSSNTTH